MIGSSPIYISQSLISCFIIVLECLWYESRIAVYISWTWAVIHSKTSSAHALAHCFFLRFSFPCRVFWFVKSLIHLTVILHEWIYCLLNSLFSLLLLSETLKSLLYFIAGAILYEYIVCIMPLWAGVINWSFKSNCRDSKHTTPQTDDDHKTLLILNVIHSYKSDHVN